MLPFGVSRIFFFVVVVALAPSVIGDTFVYLKQNDWH